MSPGLIVVTIIILAGLGVVVWIATRREAEIDESSASSQPTSDNATDLSPSEDFAAIDERRPAEPVRCPRCGSTQIHAGKKGYDTGAGCCGALLIGPLGLLCGATDSNAVTVTCLNCGHSWPAGEHGSDE